MEKSVNENEKENQAPKADAPAASTAPPEQPTAAPEKSDTSDPKKEPVSGTPGSKPEKTSAQASKSKPATKDSGGTPPAKATSDKPRETAKSTAPSTAAQSSGSGKSGWVGALALLVALGALALAGFDYYQMQRMHAQSLAQLDAMRKNLSQSQQAAEQAQGSVAQVSGTVQQLSQQLDSKQQSVDELQNRLTRGMQQITKMQGNNRRDWLLAEVEYLLRLANQRVLMENSPKGALALLQSADQILEETDDVSLYDIRKALAKDIAALEAVPKLDVTGSFVKLAALNEQVDNLRQVPVTDKGELPDLLKGITPDSVEQSWNDGLKASWNRAMDSLGQLVVVQHRDEPVEPLLSPEQNYFLQQNLHLMLEQAQLALLQGKQGPYDASLDKAKEWIRTYFESEDATTQALLKGLKEMEGLQVAPPLPDISGSLKSLKTYLSQTHEGKGAA
ncbi:uroporphyrinogen-III C-methyltransferase [Motiliproteus sp. SC1-56]|uniref:uroporphyrinogen-III C-methyltransferase n=1 Tax=Motiliproteus sp. SC1-56 TaxID=2799565 RepID=UPI001A8DA0D1|nr:uroporphyrinogen-III C-methyltransferase [Motiliproteus sp. SC1-56]